MNAKAIFFVLVLLVVTSFPTVPFMFGLVLFPSYMHLGFLVLGLICTPLFCASILLLYRERQTRKKEKAKKAMTYTI